MKCPRCWTEKAYLRTVRGWKRVLFACLLLRPLRCHHCYHRFWVPWVVTLGKQVTPPGLRILSVSQSANASRDPHLDVPVCRERRVESHGSPRADAA
jgi:hypothetical protein